MISRDTNGHRHHVMGAPNFGGTSALARVAIVDLTDGEPTPHGSAETRARESAEAARILGASA